MRALILCDGEPPSGELLHQQAATADLIIATDGAATWAQAAGVRPQVVIGDFDSLHQPHAGWEVVDAGAHGQQENSDAEKALLLALDRGATEVVLLGATGQRLDHTLANVWLAAKYHDRAAITLLDDYGACQIVSGRHALRPKAGSVISLVPLTPGVVVRTEGLKWPLAGPLEPGTRGLSNQAERDETVVEVASGLVAVMVVTEQCLCRQRSAIDERRRPGPGPLP